MKENPLQYRVRGTPVPTTRTRGTNYPESTPWRSSVRLSRMGMDREDTHESHDTFPDGEFVELEPTVWFPAARMG